MKSRASNMSSFKFKARPFALGFLLSLPLGVTLPGAAVARDKPSAEVQERIAVAAANLEDAVVVDCQLPGKLQKLGGVRTYLTPGRLTRLSAVECRTRGGEYTLGDLASGTLSLQRWLPLAQKGDPEAQYYVARIYANGMNGVAADFALAADWYKKAADQNYPAALQELGYLYEEGLGVPKDLVLALNLQRKASGLGEELDYASKITEAREDADRRVAEMSGLLEDANLQLADLRAQLGRSSDQLAKNRAQLSQLEDTVLDMRGELEVARNAPGAVDGARVRELEAALASREGAYSAEREKTARLESDLLRRQAQLDDTMARSQAASLQMNSVLGAERKETETLRTRVAQAEQRLQRSQNELTALRGQYRREVDQLSAQREEIDRARSKATGDGAALVALKQREIERAQLQVKQLEASLAAARGGEAAARNTAAGEGQAQVATMRQRMADLQARHDAQVKQVQAQKQELVALRGKSAAEQSDALQQLTRALAARNAELESRQRTIASLESETRQLRADVATMRERKSTTLVAQASENEGLKNSMRLAQERLSEMRDRIEVMQTEAATEKARLLADRDRLQRDMIGSQRASQAEVKSLKDEINAREALLAAKNQRINALEQQLSDDFATMPALAMRSPTRAATPADDAELRVMTLARQAARASRGKSYALIIANSNYVGMGPLATPGNDAREIASLLQDRYNFSVQRLNDATAEQIMIALHGYTQSLTEADSLMIYYAGHGGTADGPPERAFWLGVEADPETQKGWLSAEQIRSKVKEMKARHILLVADSCFSGAIAHPRTTTVARNISERRFQIQWERRARVVLTSGQNTPVVDSSGDRNHSLFAKYFIQILRQNDLVMSGEMLANDLNVRMKPEAARMRLNQTPTYSELKDANHEVGDFFFVPMPRQVAAL